MKSASELIDNILSSFIDEDKSKYLKFFKKWNSILGDKLSSHCAIEDVRDGSIILSFDDALWMQEFCFYKEKAVMAYVKRYFPSLNVKNIEMFVKSDKKAVFSEVSDESYIFKKGNSFSGAKKDDKKEFYNVDYTKDDRLKVLLKRLKDAIDNREKGKA